MNGVSAPRPRWYRRRGFILSVIVMVLGAGMIAGSIVTATPAHAGFLGICDADTSFPIPTDPHLSNITTLREHTPSGWAYVSASASSPAAAYPGGEGMQWTAWGVSCMDAVPQAMATGASVVFRIFAIWPLQLLTMCLGWAFSPDLADRLLTSAEPLVTAIYNGPFKLFAPIMIMFILISGIAGIVRGRTSWGWGRLAWVVVCLTGVSLLVSPSGMAGLRWANDEASGLATCAAYAVLPGGCEGIHASPPGGALVQGLAYTTWANGALGAQADVVMPATLTVTKRDEMPKFSADYTIDVPLTAIPSANGTPTWAEAWRWSGTYTAAESSRMALRGQEALRCSAVGQSPAIEDLTESDRGGLGAEQLCSLKFLVRAGMIGYLAEHDAEAYNTARATNGTALWVSLGALGILPLAAMLAWMSLLVLGNGIEFVFHVVSGSVVGLFALRDPATGRRWVMKLLQILAKRAGIGITLGLLLGFAALVPAILSAGWARTPGSATIPLVSGALQPIATAVILIVLALKAQVVLSSIQENLLAGLALESGDAAGDTVKNAGKTVLAGAVGAAAGALGAGQGARMGGAAVGALRGSRSSSNVDAALAGSRAGSFSGLRNRFGKPGAGPQPRQPKGEPATGPEPTTDETPDETPTPGPGPDSLPDPTAEPTATPDLTSRPGTAGSDAGTFSTPMGSAGHRNAALQDPVFRPVATPEAETAAVAAVEQQREAVRTAQGAHAAHVAMLRVQVPKRALQYLAGGMPEHDAAMTAQTDGAASLAQSTAALQRERDALDASKAQVVAIQRPARARAELDRRLTEGQTPTEITAALGLAAETEQHLTAYRAALAEQADQAPDELYSWER